MSKRGYYLGGHTLLGPFDVNGKRIRKKTRKMNPRVKMKRKSRADAAPPVKSMAEKQADAERWARGISDIAGTLASPSLGLLRRQALEALASKRQDEEECAKFRHRVEHTKDIAKLLERTDLTQVQREIAMEVAMARREELLARRRERVVGKTA